MLGSSRLCSQIGKNTLGLLPRDRSTKPRRSHDSPWMPRVFPLLILLLLTHALFWLTLCWHWCFSANQHVDTLQKSMGHGIVSRWIWINVSPQTYVDILRPFWHIAAHPCSISSAPRRCVIQSCSYTTKAGTWPCDIFGLPRSPQAHCFPRQDVCSLVLHRSSNPNCAKSVKKPKNKYEIALSTSFRFHWCPKVTDSITCLYIENG